MGGFPESQKSSRKLTLPSSLLVSKVGNGFYYFAKYKDRSYLFDLRVTFSVARTISVFRDTQLNSFYVYPSEWKGRLVMISVF